MRAKKNNNTQAGKQNMEEIKGKEILTSNSFLSVLWVLFVKKNK